MHSSNWKIARINLNGLNNKLYHVSALMATLNIDLLGISESWLRPVNLDSCISIPGYEIAQSVSVAAYIRNACNYSVIDCSLSNVLVIFLSTYNIFLNFVYRPPSYDLT